MSFLAALPPVPAPPALPEVVGKSVHFDGAADHWTITKRDDEVWSVSTADETSYVGELIREGETYIYAYAFPLGKGSGAGMSYADLHRWYLG